MHRVASSLLVFLLFLCYVQCQRNNGLESDADLDVSDLKNPRTSNQGWSSHDRNHSINPRHTVSKAHPEPSLRLSNSHSKHRGRTRRQLSYFVPQTKNSVDEGYRWSHTFNIEWKAKIVKKEYAQIYKDISDRLTQLLEKDNVFMFFNPSCLRISIPADNINMRIEELRIKLNKQFRDDNDGEIQHILERGGGPWNYYIPRIILKQGDKLYYRAKVKFNKEGFEATIKGLLEINMGNPHSGEHPTNTIPLCSATVVPQTQPFDFDLSSRMGDTQGPFEWNHKFTVNSTGGFTKDSAKNWYQFADYLKNFLEKNIEFNFLTPAGIMISIPDMVNLRIVDFRAKINQQFWGNDDAHFVPNNDKSGGRLRFYFPVLKISHGERVFYRMRILLGKEGLDAIVNGMLEAITGNPHAETIPDLPTRQFIAQAYQPGNSHVANSYAPVSGGQDEGKQHIYSWNNKFLTYNLNSTKGDFSKETGDRWLKDENNILKDKDIDFNFLNPTGLKILITGKDKEVLDFHVKLNEDFKDLVPGIQADITRLNDGRLSYFYPGLKLKNGDVIYYWMRVMVGRERWDYKVKGHLEFSKWGPNTGSNLLDPISIPVFYPKDEPARVGNPYTTSKDGLVTRKPIVLWDNRFRIYSPDNGGFTPESIGEANRLRNLLEKDIDFQFMNPTGLNILISGEDKGFSILALNVKVNEKFENLEPGDLVANTTMMQNGRWSYYYPNVKVKQGDIVYYWMRVTFGKDSTDAIVKGGLEIKTANPHKTGPIAPLPSANIVAHTQQSPVQSSVYQPPQTQTFQQNPPSDQGLQAQNPIPSNTAQSQGPQAQPPVSENNYQSENQVTQAQTPVPPSNNQPQSPALPLEVPDPSKSNQAPVSIPTFQTDSCASSESNPKGENNPQCVKVVTVLKPDGQKTHEVTIGGVRPVFVKD